MDTTNSTTTPPPEDPIIPIPLSLLLPLLWGYKKGADLRDRCVPGDDVVALLDAHVPAEVAAKYFVVQRAPKDKPEVLTTVWQKDEWRNSGERQEAAKIASAKFWDNIDTIITTMQQKYPMFTKDMARQFASDCVQKKDWATLTAMGINVEGME